MRKVGAVATRLGGLLLLACLAARGAVGAEPLVVGQSLPLNDASYTGRRIAAGAEIAVSSANAAGGIGGRPVRLVTLDDGGDSARHAANLRRLVAEHRAIALVNCVGDPSCRAAAAVAAELRIPFVGPISGARELRAPRPRFMFPVRPGYEREAPALMRQMRSIGTSTMAILADATRGTERIEGLLMAAQAEQIKAFPIRLASSSASEVDIALQELARGKHDAVVLDLDFALLNAVAQQSGQAGYEWPPMLAALTSGAPGVMASIFRNRVIGFTSVVPNPEASSGKLAIEFLKQADRIGRPEAIAFDGMESYLNLKVCLEGLRRAGARPDPERLAAVLDTLRFDPGDFPVSFGANRGSGSDWVEIGLRTRDGKFIH